MYILTLTTDPELHRVMNRLRKQYFPPELNKLEAHLTLFHALPRSQLDGKVFPALEALVQKTSPFKLGATTPFKLKKGIAIGLPKDLGGNAARDIHHTLLRQWDDFLSRQDRGGFQAHFTVMNKVDEPENVEKAFNEIQSGWKPSYGTAKGLTLWKYHAGVWEFTRSLDFTAK